MTPTPAALPSPVVADPDLVAAGRRAWQGLEILHVVGYFASENTEAYTDLGLDGRLAYFAARSAPMGAVGPAPTVATFYVFAPWLVGVALPGSWEVASPAQVLDARHRGVRTALTRVLGEPDVAEAVGLARQVCEALSAHGRPLYAAHAGLPWPEDDLLALWHAATLIREHRGDGHVAVLQASGIDPVESLVLGGLQSGSTRFLRKTRGWSDEEWDAAAARLTARGWLDAEGAMTENGVAARAAIEARTDALAAEGWTAIGVDGALRLAELVTPLRRAILDSDLLPRSLNKK